MLTAALAPIRDCAISGQRFVHPYTGIDSLWTPRQMACKAAIAAEELGPGIEMMKEMHQAVTQSSVPPRFGQMQFQPPIADLRRASGMPVQH